MKANIKIILALVLMIGGLQAQAQSNREDVVYLKDGTIYRGIIVEQVFNVSLTIETHDGQTHKMAIGDIQKITKEINEQKELEDAMKRIPGVQQQTDTTPHIASHDMYRREPRHHRERPTFIYPAKTGFFNARFDLDILQLGVRFTGGYRFGQFGILGIGAGIEAYAYGFSRQEVLGNDYEGWYFPVYLHYEGDILRKRVTPFYALDAGYAFRASSHDYLTVDGMDHPVYKDRAGATGTIQFGVKLHGSHHVVASWALDLNIREEQNKYSNYYYNSSGQYISVSYLSRAAVFIPGIAISVGF